MVLKVFPKGDFLGLLICCSQKFSDQETLKIPFLAISFMSNLRLTGLYGFPLLDSGGLLVCYRVCKKQSRNLLLQLL